MHQMQVIVSFKFGLTKFKTSYTHVITRVARLPIEHLFVKELLVRIFILALILTTLTVKVNRLYLSAITP